MHCRFFSSAVLACCVILTGCRDSGSGPQVAVYSASGSVKLFGAPIAGATIAFAPQDGQPTAFGTTDGQGRFTLTTYDFQDGAAAGKFKVVVSKTASAAAKTAIDPANHEAAEAAANSHDAEGAGADAANLVPPQYASASDSPLIAEVKSSGENVFNFDLK